MGEVVTAIGRSGVIAFRSTFGKKMKPKKDDFFGSNSLRTVTEMVRNLLVALVAFFILSLITVVIKIFHDLFGLLQMGFRRFQSGGQQLSEFT
ncbi:MAG: hypothetical protein JWP89_1055 [Schlesneria sp.]|nr:hypothetical protein [Schlesneria sp.]